MDVQVHVLMRYLWKITACESWIMMYVNNYSLDRTESRALEYWSIEELHVEVKLCMRNIVSWLKGVSSFQG